MPTEVATRMPTALLSLAKQVSRLPVPSVIDISQVSLNHRQSAASLSLGELFTKYGSDKATTHNYNLVYGLIFSLFNRPPRILEIGLGSNDTSIPSNMGARGKPGASLKAFKEYSPDSVVHGADIDSSIIVDSCRVFLVDQTDPASFSVIKVEGEPLYDLIVDDGLHSPDANLYTLSFALSSLSDDGFVVIEDISPACSPIWQVAQQLLNGAGYRSVLIKTRSAFLFLATKRGVIPGLI